MSKQGIWQGVAWLVIALFVAAPATAQTWAPGNSGTAETLNASWFIDGQRGWMVGDAGTFRVTSNGGQTWAPIPLTVEDLQDVAFRNDSLGLVVGDNGRIFRTVNGLTWTPVASGTDINLATVAFGGGSTVYAAGRDGIILRSTNDGLTWGIVEVGAARYRDATAIGARAWIVGNEGVVRATSDGGASWVDQTPGTANDLKGVSFVSETMGWIAGQNDTLLHTTDGGASWNPRNGGIVNGLDSVFFGNASLGWAVGNNGVVYATANGGIGWIAEPSGTTVALGHVFFSNAFHGVAVGDAGTVILRTAIAVSLGVEPNEIRWDTSSAAAYDVVAGDLALLRAGAGDFAAATSRCVANDATASPLPFDQDPAPGQAIWLVIRTDEPGATGSYDSGTFVQVGTRDPGIAASGVGCP